MKPRILYAMHVDWDWIKQRPHFIAEELASGFDLTLLYPFNYRRDRLIKRASDARIRRLPLWFIPCRDRYSVLLLLNRFVISGLIWVLIRAIRPEIIWITHPLLYEYFPRRSGRAKLVYDCMDDPQGFFFPNNTARERIVRLERRLLEAADLVFVSSARLQELIETRADGPARTVLIRNAFGGAILPDKADQAGPIQTPGRVIIGYCGTVSTWFDFAALQYCLDRHPELEFLIIGPVDHAVPLQHERIHYTGPVPHAELYGHVQDCSALIMPFTTNELVRSVDPIKLYEYINFAKPIIAVYYEEIRQFSGFVDFYTTPEELLRVIQALQATGFAVKYSARGRMAFLEENSWRVRAELIRARLAGLLKSET
jgi:teichuronic acid biosynthesis glycosyltransferase TuaH